MMTAPSFPILEPEGCDDCGLCCEGVGSPVLLYQSLPQRNGPHPSRPPDLPRELIAEIDHHFRGLARGEEAQDQCLWYDTVRLRCRHYEWRPKICRDYELGGQACLQLREPWVSS